MRYTRLILAFVLVLVIVTMVGSLTCDSYSDIDDPLVMSSEFGSDNKDVDSMAFMKAQLPSLRQDAVTVFAHINFNKDAEQGSRNRTVLEHVPFEKETNVDKYWYVKMVDPGSKGGSLYTFMNNKPMSAYIPPGYTLDVYYSGYSTDGSPSRTYGGGTQNGQGIMGGFKNLEKNDCNPCKSAVAVRVTKVGGSSDKSTQSTSSGTCMPHDTTTYKYRTRKKYGNDWKCPKGWEDTGCDNPNKRQCRVKRDNKQDVDGSKSSKDKIRKKCDKMARKHKGVFAVCKDVKGGKRRDCLGKRNGPMEKCLRREHKKQNQSHGSSSETSLMLYHGAAFGGHPMPFTGYAAMNLSKVDRKQASSAKVSPGFKAVLFSGTNFKGKSTTLTEGQYSSMPGGWDDRVSSVSIKKA